MSLKRFSLIGAAASTLLGVAAGPAIAQQAGGQTPPAPSEEVAPRAAPVVVEEEVTAEVVIVTARKREESLQEVPVAIDVFSSKDIKESRIESLSDLSKLSAGLNFTPLFGAQNQLPVIRGQAQTIGQLNVGVFIDGIYLSGNAAIDTELNDLERIEIVKGPQSALYGRNTFAGAINYVTKRPTSTWQGDFEVTGAEKGYAKTLASISGPITDTLRMRVGGYYKQFDGWYTSAIDGGDVDFVETFGGLATLEYAPTDQFRATLRISGGEEDNGQPAASLVRTNAFPGVVFPGQIRNRLFVGEIPPLRENGLTINTVDGPVQQGELGQRSQTVRSSLDLVYEFDQFDVRSVTSYSHRTGDFTIDGDNTICDATPCANFGPPIALGTSRFSLSSQDQSFTDISQELRLTSTGMGPFSWILGAFYYSNETDILDRSFDNLTAAAVSTFPFARSVNETESVAGFASLAYAVTDRLNISGELRYEEEKQTFERGPSNPNNVNIPPPGTPTRTLNLEDTFEFVTPRVTADYWVGEDKMIYASVSRGAKTGGFNTNANITDAQRAFDPEYSVNYELGAKTRWLSGLATLNGAIYHVEWEDQQVACQNPGVGGATQRTYTCNVGQAQITGLELDGAVKLGRFVTVKGTYAYTDATYTSFVDDSLAGILTALGQPQINYDGKRLPYVPEHAFTLTPTFDAPIANNLRLFAQANVSYEGETFLRADNLQKFGAQTVTDIRAGLYGERWRFTAFANNVFDDDTPKAGVRFFDSVNYSVPAPLVFAPARRLVGASLAYRFGGN